MVFGIVTPHNSNTPEAEKDLYQTPPEIFQAISKLYGPFRVDGAANERNHLLPQWMGPGSTILENALKGDWDFPGQETRIFINPPWSRGNIYAFVKKAHEQHSKGTALATLLLPATTDVSWFHDFVWNYKTQEFHPWLHVYFIQPRVRYIRPNGEIAKNPGMGSMVVSFRPWRDEWNQGSSPSKSELLNVYGEILEKRQSYEGR